jgi:uncharacterized repeat protein (TIGR01451 family)
VTTVERTQRWRVAFVVVLATSSAGVYLGRPTLLLASSVGAAYAAYPLLTPDPAVEVALTRTVSDRTPDHGDPVTVTVTVTNTGSRTLADLRVADGVPPLLAVTDGTARCATTLSAGESTTFEYTVEAKAGSHPFDPATVVAYDVSGGLRATTTVEVNATGDGAVEAIECPVAVSELGLRGRARRSGGRTAARSGDSGTEFDRTRAFRPGDPVAQVDWRRFARTGDLATVEFREERRRTVVVCLDARPRAARRAGPTEPHAVSYGVAAATALLSHLLARGDRVGVAVFGAEFAWLAPGTGPSHRAEAETILDAHRTGVGTDGQNTTDAAEQSAAAEQVRAFRARSSGAVDVILVSPLLDEFGTSATRRLEALGHAVTVVSPDVTTDETPGGALARLERHNRLRSLRARSLPVRNWTPGEPIGRPTPGRER